MIAILVTRVKPFREIIKHHRANPYADQIATKRAHVGKRVCLQFDETVAKKGERARLLPRIDGTNPRPTHFGPKNTFERETIQNKTAPHGLRNPERMLSLDQGEGSIHDLRFCT